MEFSEILGFLKILGKSMKVALKNGKSIASMITLSSVISSILIILFSLCYKSVKAYIIKNSSSGNISSLQFIIYVALVVSVELSFIYAYTAITSASGIGAILATATTDANVSLQHLFSMVKTKWRSPFKCMRRKKNNYFCGGGSYSWRYLTHFLLFVAVAVAILVVRSNPNTLTITIVSVVAVAFFVSLLDTSVARTLSAVIPVVEDSCEEAEALEKAVKLVQGQRLHGFMLNLFFYLLAFVVVFSFWKIVGDKGSLNLMVYGLLIVNFISLGWILVCVVYTVYYFQCMQYHGQTIQPLIGTHFHYTTLLPHHIP